MNKDIQFFYCYDLSLHEYLKEKGFRHITKARHLKTNKIFTMYIQCIELTETIAAWKNKRNT